MVQVCAVEKAARHVIGRLRPSGAETDLERYMDLRFLDGRDLLLKLRNFVLQAGNRLSRHLKLLFEGVDFTFLREQLALNRAVLFLEQLVLPLDGLEAGLHGAR